MEKEIMYKENEKSENWRKGKLLGFGIDYEIISKSDGTVHTTKAIVLTSQGSFLLLSLDLIHKG